MINRTITYALLALLTLGLVGCTQEDDFTPQDGDNEIRINFTAGSIQTRVNTLEDGSQWENGDQIIIQQNYVGDWTFTATVTDDGTTWKTDKKFCWCELNNMVTLYACYPTSAYKSFDNLTVPEFDLPTDQSTMVKLKSADYMNGGYYSRPTTNQITIQMKHRMSMITVKYPDGSAISDEKVYAIDDQADFNAGNMSDLGSMYQEYIYDNSFTTAITPHHDAENRTITAIVIPCTYPVETKFMEIKVGDETLTVKMPKEMVFVSGNHYTFNLTIGEGAEPANAKTRSVQQATGSTDVTLQLVSVTDMNM